VELQGRVAVVTGGANGIGAAMCRRFSELGARAVVVVDIDGTTAEAVANEIGGRALQVDVSQPRAMHGLVERVEADVGPIDLFCSNAGVAATGGVEQPVSLWQRHWDVNVMAHVHAANAVLPGMLERGYGYLLQTASAAGLLTSLGAAPYSVTKHGAVALAEWLAITYGERGIRVSCLCPQFVDTRMVSDLGTAEATRLWMQESTLPPGDVAAAVVAGLREERFLILPHPEVAGYFEGKARDHDAWIAGMRRLQAKVLPIVPEPRGARP
jgi:NAD(P)-dependent dehydrogenase (short-subunit alcohol dehydrogenase family)